ncbi:bifunctional 5,10-methylenetetrahydrofolate dehydrogenase/5,10-methenyltetrahydrofolate cyclohydrolase, partial [Patescibacteria group bacterium]|nr:bifunctional 5,10-methylenetetrahydrofolate dehydrogenase/5,10-methenyltetrahydrofolate cyclohydrolase [Patescibacteria group bacterium]
IDGKKIADSILARLKKEIERRRINPCLAVILVGDNPSSVLYIKAKEKAAEKIGVRIKKFFLPANSSENEILEVIKKLNNNLEINGILVQMPLPKGISPDRIIKEISPEKDVDGLLPKSGFDSPFILSIWEALQATKENLENKKIIALVNSEIFGERMSMFFKQREIEIMIGGLPPKLEADILITALGKPGVIKGNMVKQGVILIDGGISRVDGRTAGDIDEESVKQKAKWLSPVPGGLGPLTVAFLLKNLI